VSSKILLKKIVETTGNFVSKFDKNFSNDIFSGEITWPAEIFFKKIITSYSSCIHVATTNYDLLAEYSFEKNKIPFDTGFDGKIFNDLNWTSSHRRMVAINKKVSRRKTRSNFEEIPHIAFYKVHGSLNTFILDNRIIETNLWAHDKPDFIERLIVTPGTSKFEFLHNFRYELLTKFDESVQNHNFFIFLGFGFNDSQITNSAMQNKLFSNKCNGLIITKSSNNNIESFLSKSENLFLICERNGKPEDTIIKHRNFSEDLIIENQQLWDISNFSKIILGG
jgi:hypothetical protein